MITTKTNKTSRAIVCFTENYYNGDRFLYSWKRRLYEQYKRCRRRKDIPDNFPAEDLVLKSSMQFFGDELLSYLGITAEPVTVGPTEFVYLTAKQLYEDF